MTGRNKWALQIAGILHQWEYDPRSVNQLLTALEEMRLDALEPAERDVYSWIVELKANVTSQHVAAEFNIKQNHASGLLKALASYGLLDRREVRHHNGKTFIYTVHHL